MQFMKIVILDGYTENPGDLSWSGLEAFGELTVYDRTPLNDDDEIVRRIGDAEIVYTNKTPLRRTVFERYPSMRFVGVLVTGYNIVDVAAADDHDVTVCNIPSYGTDAVAQFAIAMLMEICHGVAHHSQAVHEGRWENCPDFCFWDTPQIELTGKTLGVIGFGRIGRATARIAAAMGMRILAYNDGRETEEGRRLGQYVTLDELLAQSDVITLHCPLTPRHPGHHQPRRHRQNEGRRNHSEQRPRAADCGRGSRPGAGRRQCLRGGPGRGFRGADSRRQSAA